MKWRIAKNSIVIKGALYGTESIITDDMLEEGKVTPRNIVAFKENGTLVPYEEQDYQFGEEEEETPSDNVVQIDEEIGTEETSG